MKSFLRVTIYNCPMKLISKVFLFFAVFSMNYFDANAQENLDPSYYPLIHHNLDKDELGQHFLVRGKKY